MARLSSKISTLKAEQLEVLLLLYEEYKYGNLPPDVLYFYLDYHAAWLKEMDKAIKDNALELFDKIPNHLANIPRGWVVLADRGFAFDALKYPNLNAHVTPAFAKTTAFAQETLEDMWKICMLRWSSETHISFVTDTGCLQDEITYGTFPIIQNAVDWACGLSNFNQPL